MITKKNSFTLLELLIVLVIIGILVTLALPRYMDSINKARCAEAKQVLRAQADAIWQYYTETSSMPTDINSVDIKAPASKYFNYFFTAAGATASVSANAKFNGSNGLSYRTYTITYDTNPLAPNMQPGSQMMDSKYSRVYTYVNWSDPVPTTKYGWD